MPTADGAGENLLDPHLIELEDAHAWCVEHRAHVRYYGDGHVLIKYDDVKLQHGESFLEAIALAQGEEPYEDSSD